MTARFLTYAVTVGLLAALPGAACASSEQAVTGWLRQSAPMILANEPERYTAMMESKAPYFTQEGFNGYQSTMERTGANQQAVRLAAMCLTNVHQAEGGTWIIDAQLIYKKPVPATDPVDPETAKTTPPKPRPNPYLYQTAQFYVRGGDAATPYKISQYIPDPGPKDGFPNCRAPGELEEKIGAIDDQLVFYESTLETLQERIAELKQQRAALQPGGGAQAVTGPAAGTAPQTPPQTTAPLVQEAPAAQPQPAWQPAQQPSWKPADQPIRQQPAPQQQPATAQPALPPANAQPHVMPSQQPQAQIQPQAQTQPQAHSAEQILAVPTRQTQPQAAPAANAPAVNVPSANAPAANAPAGEQPATTAPQTQQNFGRRSSAYQDNR